MNKRIAADARCRRFLVIGHLRKRADAIGDRATPEEA